MDDALLVRGSERIGDLRGDVQRFLERNRALRIRSASVAFDELHHQEVRTDIEETADVRVIERGDQSCLAFESLAEALGGHLDGHVAAQARIARAIHFTHSARADLGDDLVRTQFLAYGKRHHLRAKCMPAKRRLSKHSPMRQILSAGPKRTRPTGGLREGREHHLARRAGPFGHARCAPRAGDRHAGHNGSTIRATSRIAFKGLRASVSLLARRSRQAKSGGP